MSKQKLRFRVGQRVIISGCPATIVRKSKAVWYVSVAGQEFPVYADEIRKIKKGESSR